MPTDPSQPPSAPDTTPAASRGGILDAIEWIGNKLPDPVLLFLFGAILVMVLSQIAVWTAWEVQPVTPVQVVGEDGESAVTFVDAGDVITPVSLLTPDGLYWALSSMVENFMGFAPLGVVLTGMLGIGVAERTGMLGAMLKAFMLVVPKYLLTPTMVFLGIMSSMGIDAGYVVLPPLAAALYKSVGRSPLAGLAAVFAGVSAGFNANLFVTGLDPMLAELSQTGAQVIEPGYAVAATCNWWFMIASTFVITMTGWCVTSWFVERRLSKKAPEDGGPSPIDEHAMDDQGMKAEESTSLLIGAGVMGGLIVLMIALVMIPGSPLYDPQVPNPADEARPLLADITPDARIDDSYTSQAFEGEGVMHGIDRDGDGAIDTARVFVRDDGTTLTVRSPQFPRWVDAVTPLIFLGFVLPGIAYGVSIGSIKGSKDAARVMIESIAAMAPIIVLAFFAAQFIEYLKYSQLDRMLAYAGGISLAKAELGTGTLVIAFILLTMVFNMFVGSMSAKYTMFAPIFVPMLMFVGISPELTQAAYRIGDSTTNIITPLNAYLVIILVFMQKHAPRGGMGTLISMMMPYTVVFTIVWSVMLLIWIQAGWDLGPGGPLAYEPAASAEVASAASLEGQG
ncbi:MAG: AbgT family transporter [Planctomycetota bacterium]